MREFETVVVGAGQAGLAISYLLAEAGVSHVVFEKGKIGESWRSQRWDSFALNTPNWANLLPGTEVGGKDPDAFGLRDDLVETLEEYAASFSAPIEAGSSVVGVERDSSGSFHIETVTGEVRADNVVVCSGSMSTPNMPRVAQEIDPSITTLSAATYKRADELPEGGVVVVGSGQSGCQVVEDLLDSGRQVYLCVSKVGRIPREYRGRDFLSWATDMGMYDERVENLEDPAMQFAAQPQVSGTRGGHTVSLQSLARDGASLIGRVSAIDGTVLRLERTVHECIDFADERCGLVKSAIDDWIAKNGIDAPAPTPDPYEPALGDLGGSDQLDELDLGAAGVSTIIWCVGFHGDFSWIKHDIMGEGGIPRHERGVSEVPGLYFVGFPWLSKRKSGILMGVGEDARYVVDQIVGTG